MNLDMKFGVSEAAGGKKLMHSGCHSECGTNGNGIQADQAAPMFRTEYFVRIPVDPPSPSGNHRTAESDKTLPLHPFLCTARPNIRL
jgi:hypothetical protein